MMKNILGAVAVFLAATATGSAMNVGELDAEKSVRLSGFVGDRINSCIETRVLGQDVEHITDPFKHKNDTASWQTEFWGKWVQGAIASYRYNQDPALKAKIAKSVEDIIATQQPDGYIGNYAPEAHLKQWDVWGRKYTALGLLHWYKLTGDKKALDATRKLIDHLMTEVGPDATPIETVGNYHGMAASSVLEPVVYLYNETGDKKYLDYALYIVDSLENPDGSKLISKALAGEDVAARFPHPADWFSPENGQKAYEMMSCYVGLIELYKVTGNKAYLDAAERAVENIIEKEINIAGSGSSFESWYHGKEFQTLPTYHTMETCVTFTWMQILDKLLEITGKSSYADEIEKTVYNALLASLKDDASQIAKYSPIVGHRFEGEEQCGLHINCCNANGPRGFALIPEFAVKSNGKDEVFVNYLGEMNSELLLGKNRVALTQQTAYPATDNIKITVDPSKETEFTLNIRIPLWSAKSQVKVNGKDVPNVIPGAYAAIDRKWKKGDVVEVSFDMPVKLNRLNNQVAVTRGPIVFARDSRIGDGFVDETVAVADKDGIISDAEVVEAPGFAWLAVSVPVTVGANLEGTDAERKITLCDFASAGNTWDPAVRYRVWLPETLNIKLKRNY